LNTFTLQAAGDLSRGPRGKTFTQIVRAASGFTGRPVRAIRPIGPRSEPVEHTFIVRFGAAGRASLEPLAVDAALGSSGFTQPRSSDRMELSHSNVISFNSLKESRVRSARATGLLPLPHRRSARRAPLISAAMGLVLLLACALAFAQGSPFLTGATALQSNILAFMTPIAVILVMALGAMAMANRISWGWCIAAIVGIAITFGAQQVVTWVRGMFGV